MSPHRDFNEGISLIPLSADSKGGQWAEKITDSVICIIVINRM